MPAKKKEKPNLDEALEKRFFDDAGVQLNLQIDSKIAEQPRRKAFQEYWRAKD